MGPSLRVIGRHRGRTEPPLDAPRRPASVCRPWPTSAHDREGIAGSPHAGPFPVGAYAAKLRDELRKRARVQLFGEVFGLRAGRARVWFELRDAEGAVPCAMWRDAFEELRLPAGRAGRRRAGRRRRRPRLLPGLAHGLAVVLVRRQRPAARRRGRPARPARGPAQDAGRRGAVRAAEAPAAPGAAAHDRRGDRRGRQGARRRARRPAPPRLGGAARVGLRPGAGPPRGAGHHPRAAGPRRRRRRSR